MRCDVHAQWGFPEEVDEGLPRMHLADVLQPVDDDDDVWLQEGTEVRWLDGVQRGGPFGGIQELKPVVVGTVEDGGWGKRIYANMVPATKASSWGPGGRTHLVAQLRRGCWWARRLTAEEVTRMFGHPNVPLELAESGDTRIAELGNAGPCRMVRPWALGIVKFLRPPMQWCPVSIAELISDDTVRVCRGWMSQAKTDFDHMAKMG